MKRARQSLLAIFLLPTLLAIVTIVGLVAGLLGDGGEDIIASIGIGLPVLATVVALGRRYPGDGRSGG